MVAPQSYSHAFHEREEFKFSRQPRKIEAVEAIPFLWPTKASIANEYIDSWRDDAAKALAQLKLSTRTLSCIFSHTSRRDGTCSLTDKALSARSGRSVASTKRDVQRLKRLGFIEATYEGGDSHQERVRVLRIVVPLQPRSSQRIPASSPKTVAARSATNSPAIFATSSPGGTWRSSTPTTSGMASSGSAASMTASNLCLFAANSRCA